VMVANVVQQQVPIIFVLGTKTIELLQTIWVTLHLWRTFTGCGMFIIRNQYFSYAQLLILRFTETFVSYVMFSLFFFAYVPFQIKPFWNILQWVRMEKDFCLVHMSGSMRHMFGGGMHGSCRRYWKKWLMMHCSTLQIYWTTAF
jgi:hypothetical protein